jgi:hypothetical protein
MGRESAYRYGPPGPIFLQAAEGQGAFACSDWSSGFLFSWEVTMSQDVMTRAGLGSLPRRTRFPILTKCAQTAMFLGRM